MTITNQIRREVMVMAWDFRRAEPARAFADCLRAAWACTKRLAKAAAKIMARAAGGRVLRLSPSLIQSPLRRATASQRYAGRADWDAARTTSRLGA